VYFSRSRQKLWHKGEESGHFKQFMKFVWTAMRCNYLQIEQHGGIACHTGRESCFYRKLTPQGWEIVDAQLKDPTAIYGAKPKVKVTIMLQQVDVLAHLGN
jgi:phosphoribosyl-ATP pyrophosphohydrolase/phosphoribosyl-AMP cyclohydrolase